MVHFVLLYKDLGQQEIYKLERRKGERKGKETIKICFLLSMPMHISEPPQILVGFDDILFENFGVLVKEDRFLKMEFT